MTHYRKWVWLVVAHPLLAVMVCRCLCKDVHALMRVMWSGKWAMVTPHAVLNAVWRLIPSFSGYSQQDAQEFLW